MDTDQRSEDVVKHLVVGVDGSAGSAAALEWACATAGATGAVHAVRAIGPNDDLGSAQRELADSWLAGFSPNGTDLVAHVVVGDAVTALLGVGDRVGADAIVVGAHGRSVREPRALGHVTAELIEQSPRPLIVVREADERVLGPGATIVVGVGHSDATTAALTWAARLARERGAALSLVRATGTPRLFADGGLLELLAYYIDPGKVQEWAADDLRELADELRDSVDGRLQVSWTATSGRAGPRLVDAATDAALLAIGRPRDGGFTDRPARAALHHAVTRAPCPVAVVPVPTDHA